MKFCQYCGKQLQDNEICSCQNAQFQNSQPQQPFSAKEAYQQQFNTTTQPNTQPNFNQAGNNMQFAPAQPSQFSTLLNQAVETFKGFFSNKYENTLKASADDKSHQWLLFAVVSIIFSGISSLELVATSLGKFSNAGSRSTSFFTGMLSTAAVFFGFATMIFVISKIYKRNVSYINALNLTACAYLPILLGTTVNFLFIPIASLFALLISIIVHIMFFTLIFIAVRNIIPSEKNIFWPFTVAITVTVVAVTIVYATLMLITFGSTITSFLGMLSGKSIF
ncbi:MAG: hypothetical protein IJV39_01455 [Ruminococcus sp.]|nr:hypothetical protein [Ruminococcus sp.]